MKYIYIFEVYNYLKEDYDVEYITDNEKSAEIYFKFFIGMHENELIRIRTDYANYYREVDNA